MKTGSANNARKKFQKPRTGAYKGPAQCYRVWPGKQGGI